MIHAQTLKGFRDFLPQEAIKRHSAIKTIQTVFERFGFDPLETPALEYASTLVGKYGDEADKLLYIFEDHGKRSVGMRYDQTVPTARVVAQYPDITKPFKRYQIQPVWRAENTQKGRFREFLQCDADIIGSPSIVADAEIITLAAEILNEFGITDYTIFLNDRSLFGTIPIKAIIIIDKLDKIGPDGVKSELSEKGFDPLLLDELTQRPLPPRLTDVINLLPSFGVVSERISFSPTLARGLDYYTSTIFEIKIHSYTAGSVCGGGRYDHLIEQFIGTQSPAVGFAFGFDRLIDVLSEKHRFPDKKTNTMVLVTIFQESGFSPALSTLQTLRKNNVASELFLDVHAKLEKQLKYADHKGIPFVVIQGPDEQEKNVYTVKNMKTHEQHTHLSREMMLSMFHND